MVLGPHELLPCNHIYFIISPIGTMLFILFHAIWVYDLYLGLEFIFGLGFSDLSLEFSI